MVPDLCHHALCGQANGEYTNASTTQLLDVRTRAWADDLFSRLSLPREIMPEVVPPGTDLGELRPALQRELGLGPLRVLAPATHDTGSAVAGTPLEPGWAYVSSGTWSLVGVERTSPLVNDAVARANFTNEGGAFGTVRFLKNVMGLWILDSCRQEWEERGLSADLDSLLAAAAAIERPPGLVFPDHPRFFNPASMTAELQGALAETGQRVPDDPARLTRVVLDSLAFRYASVVSTIEALSGEAVPGHPHRRGRLPERLPEPGDRRRRLSPRPGRPRGSDGHRQPAAPGGGLREARLARRGPPAGRASRSPASVRAARRAALDRGRRALPRDRGTLRLRSSARIASSDPSGWFGLKGIRSRDLRLIRKGDSAFWMPERKKGWTGRVRLLQSRVVGG